MYNSTYGLADFNESTTRTDQVLSTIRYHAVEQATAWLQGDVGYKGSGGDEDHYWSTYAVRALIVAPYMDYTNSVSDPEFLTTGSTTSEFLRLVIPTAQIVGFAVIVVLSISWCSILLTWSLMAEIVQPNNSLYPEIDFGSKCVQSEHERMFSRDGEPRNSVEWVHGIGGLLAPLSNATTFEVAREIKGVSVHTGATRKSVMDLPHVILATGRSEVDDLRVGLNYR